VPLGIVRRIGDEIGRGRVEGVGERVGFAVEASVTEGAIHGVELHAVLKVLIVRRHWVREVWGVALHRGVDGAHGDAGLEVGRGYVGSGGKESEHGQAEAAED
jgi:hypothetical protein